MGFIRRRFPEPHRELTDLVSYGQTVSPHDKAQGQNQTIHVSTQAATASGSSSGGSDSKALKLIGQLLIALGVLLLVIVVWVIGFSIGQNTGYADATEEWSQYPVNADRPYILPTEEGGPCRGFDVGGCVERDLALSNIERSRYFLRRGDAEVAIGEREKARIFYDWAVDLGRSGSTAGKNASRRLNFLSMTCDFSEESLTRVARDNEFNPLGGDITVRQRQQALKALSHYAGEITGRYNPETMAAISDFQRSLWYPETGVLTAEQTVVLVCGAAEIAEDPEAQNLLGTMYAVGLGVRQNTDQALYWFNQAAKQGSPDAYWNLALLFGTRTTESSIFVCDADFSPERADSFLKEAYKAGHPGAVEAVKTYGDEPDPAVRWKNISGDLRQPEGLTRVGKGCNPNG